MELFCSIYRKKADRKERKADSIAARIFALPSVEKEKLYCQANGRNVPQYLNTVVYERLVNALPRKWVIVLFS
ncbi:hypothetical protein EI42_00490 [Thermosporothrix hazakensis]|jgi:hypothetical protein|uniref:Uncharacterized protein n=1 Tax=Thermosporothrix hazakensis TaxID=644383 RepID=A0A326UDF8_THEHA|nr:hypothetical protein EI42_00490 [Thermosporothrix hazakensis]